MNNTYLAFLGHTHLGTGPLADVLKLCYPHRESTPSPLIFDSFGHQTDFDWTGTLDEVVARALPPPPPKGPGRPKLGVKSVEVTLLPRHWDWLDQQPARASGTLRRLVEAAMAGEAANPKRRAEALGRILWAVAGNETNFEEATRALYAGDNSRLSVLTADWPGDLPLFIADFLTAD